MADVDNDELEGLTRAYLNRRTAQLPPRDLEDRVTRFVFARRRMTRVAGAIEVATVVLVSAAAAAAVLAFHNPAPTGVAALGTPEQVQIVRTSGGLALPPLNKTVNASQVVARLAADVEGLPLQPVPWHCPADLGTSYRLHVRCARRKLDGCVRRAGVRVCSDRERTLADRS